MAQHLIGYTPRVYLNNVFTNPIAQYKFYQGFIRDKGTKNAINAFTAAGFNGLTSKVSLFEEWAMRVGEYGALDNSCRYCSLMNSTPRMCIFSQIARFHQIHLL
mgnify:CR=1 FL=1